MRLTLVCAAAAAALFNGPYRREGVVNQDEFNAVFGNPPNHNGCGMQRPGFNIQCNDGNRARWGYCANIPSQDCQTDESHDADAAIGLGIEGQDCCPIGAGYTNYFVSNTANSGQESRQQVWVFVRQAASCATYSFSEQIPNGNCLSVSSYPH